MSRARSLEAKAQRRSQILAAAVERLAQEPYDLVTVSSIARAAGVAKGTPYLYWATKEELFLAALQDEYERFLAELAAAVGRCPPTVEAVADRVAREVVAHGRLGRLIGLLHAVLERNASVEAVVAFKFALLRSGTEVALAFRDRFPWLSLEAAVRLLQRLHGAMVAYRQMADPPPIVARALETPELSMFRVDLESELRELVHDLLVAARERSHG